ncbi:MAG: penicillin-binding protein 1A [Methylococcaceae bacterium]
MLSKKALAYLALFLTLVGISAILLGNRFYQQLAAELPDVKSLHNVQYQIPLSVYSKDLQLIAQFGEKRRTPININEVPQLLINAFLAAEDEDFFKHPGVDYKGLVRAAWQLALTGKKKQGGSTITMQVTRNFLLNNEKTFTRKIKEIILALKIENEYSKNEILELYLNQIYMGHRAYGIVAAAQTYYGRPLSQLDLAEYAMIAGLPKAPSAYNPITNEVRAIQRRNYVLRRMFELNFINQQDFDYASAQSSSAKLQFKTPDSPAPFLAEMVRQKMLEVYGEQAYTSGLNVYTTLDSNLQKAADDALRNALHTYDERHRYWSPPQTNINKTQNFSELPIVGDTLPAYIVAINKTSVTAKLQNDATIEIPGENFDWPQRKKKLSSQLNPGDIVRVRELPDKTWGLTQIPQAEGAFASINPNNGAILALTGGFDFFYNKYNRATQSKRQPGSGFKPIIYTAALEEGYTTASLINDAPLVIDIPGQETEWRPENYNKKFSGLTTLRSALTHSRNIISIRLLKDIGITKAVDTAKRFGFSEEQLPKTLSLALGSGYASPLQMARAYAVFANGGFLIKPYFIDRIVSDDGKLIYQAKPKTACPTCDSSQEINANYAPRIISPRVNFLMNSMLRDVVQRGTATAAKVLARLDLAGKTGTTNDQRDAWFNGYTETNAASAWVGFDNFAPLGERETGGAAALPMWIDYMRVALKDTQETELIAPPGISKAYINPYSGLLASSQSKSGIWEYFQTELVPSKTAYSENAIADGTDEPNSEKILEELF